MARLRFSETLKNKRHELGLTIAQASAVLKLKEQVLIAFEEGDFENMPKSGYAQGMLASYARYLGLSPRELVDMYSEELYEYVHGSSSHDLRRRTRDTRSGRIIDGYDVPNESESRPKAYVQLQSYLPTAGGPMGDYGAFATTSGVHSRATGEIVTPASSSQYNDYAAGWAYGSTSYSGRAQRASSYSRKRGDEGGRASRSRSRALRRDDITTRSVSRSQFDDDRVLDDEAVPYEAASSVEGRRSSHGIATIERPNLNRTRQRSDLYASKERREPSGGILGSIVDWFRDSHHAMALVIVALGLVLTGVAIFSIRSCVSNTGTEATTNRTVGVTPAQSSTDTQNQSGDGTQQSSSSSPAGASEQVPIDIKKPEEPTVVMVKVQVADGQVSWLEVQADGQSSIAETVSGPWEQTYDVKEQLIVRAGDIAAVSVFVNGEQQQFEMKSSGVGTITVDGPPKTEADPAAAGSAAEGEKAEGAEGEGTTESGAAYETPEEGSKNADGDEYQYTYNGFDIYVDHKNGNLYCIDPATGAKLNPADGTPYTG